MKIKAARFVYATFPIKNNFNFIGYYKLGKFNMEFELNNKNEPRIFIVNSIQMEDNDINWVLCYRNIIQALQNISKLIDEGFTDFEILQYGCTNNKL